MPDSEEYDFDNDPELHTDKSPPALLMMKQIAFAMSCIEVLGQRPGFVKHEHQGQTYDALEVIMGDNFEYAMRMCFDVNIDGKYEDRMCFSNGLTDDDEEMMKCNKIAVLYGDNVIDLILKSTGRSRDEFPEHQRAITIVERNLTTGAQGEAASLDLSELGEIAQQIRKSKETP
jgi:hypothetical protein